MDQKKKDLPPSTLPSEHKQWGQTSNDKGNNGGGLITWPLTFRSCFIVLAAPRGYGHGGFTVGGNNAESWVDAENGTYIDSYYIIAIGD